jgi:pimeloyl-ACP methyl ester carboxylesterase
MARTRQKSLYEAFNKEFRYIKWSDNGPLIHIAHATGLCANAYSEFSEKLDKKYKVVALDFRGHGKTLASADSTSLNNWEIFYKDLEEFFRSFNQPVVAFGHSMGGTVSAVLAARYPELVSRLIVVEPGFMPPLWRPFVYFVQKSGLSMHVPFVTSVTKRNKTWKNKTEAMNALSIKGPFKTWSKKIIEDYLNQGTKILEDGSLELLCDPIWEGKILATAPVGIWGEVSNIKCPTLVIYGEQSKTFLPSVVTKLKKTLPQVMLKKIQNCGHFIPMEQPEKLAEIVIDFVDNPK